MYNFFVGVDCGGTKIKVSYLNSNYKFTSSEFSSKDLDFRSFIEKLITHIPDSKSIKSICFSVRGMRTEGFELTSSAADYFPANTSVTQLIEMLNLKKDTIIFFTGDIFPLATFVKMKYPSQKILVLTSGTGIGGRLICENSIIPISAFSIYPDIKKYNLNVNCTGEYIYKCFKDVWNYLDSAKDFLRQTGREFGKIANLFISDVDFIYFAGGNMMYNDYKQGIIECIRDYKPTYENRIRFSEDPTFEGSKGAALIAHKNFQEACL